MRRLVALMTLLVMTPAALADEVAGTLGGRLAETLHTVEIAVEDGVAVQTVTRSFANDGASTDELVLTVTLPRGGVVTSLRVKNGGRWIDGKLLLAEEAAERYLELTTEGDAKPRAMALMAWDGEESATLSVFPLRARETLTVSYTILSPVFWQGGRHYVAVGPGTEDVRPTVRLDAGAGRDLKTLAPTDAPAFDDDDDLVDMPGGLWVSFVKGAPRDLEARLGVVPVADGEHIVRLELDVAARLGVTPKQARVVFVLDASHSQGAAGIDNQLSLVRGYLAHVPDARVELVAARRGALRVFGELVPARDLDARLEELPAGTLAPGNGSALDAGVALAADVLAGEKGPHRIVAFTDERLRSALDSHAASAAVRRAPEGTIVHFVNRPPIFGAIEEGRVRDHFLGDVAAVTGGVYSYVWGDGTPDEMARLGLALVRPVRIEDLDVSWVDARAEDEDATLGLATPEVIEEGGGLRRLQIVGTVDRPRTARVTGKIWARELSLEVPVSKGLSEKTMALVFGHTSHLELTDEQARALALVARVVSPYTSYLAAAEDAAPSTAGFERAIGDLIGMFGGTYGTSSSCSITCGGGRALDHHADVLRAWIQPGAEACAAQAGVREGTITVRLEYTGDEVVDVEAVTSSEHPAVRACVTELAWGLRLDRRFVGDGTVDVLMILGAEIPEDVQAERPSWML